MGAGRRLLAGDAGQALTDSDSTEGKTLSNRTLATVQKVFMDEVESAFRFLIDEFSMLGPERSHVVVPSVSYTDGKLRCRVLFEDGSVTTRLEIEVDGVRMVADLPEIVFAADLGSRNEVVRVAHTMRRLEQALMSQAGFVRKLYPLVTGQGAAQLLEKSGAQTWRVR